MRISDANRNDQVQMQQAHISFRDILFCTGPPSGFTHTSVATGDIGKVQLGSVLPLKGVGFLFSSLWSCSEFCCSSDDESDVTSIVN